MLALDPSARTEAEDEAEEEVALVLAIDDFVLVECKRANVESGRRRAWEELDVEQGELAEVGGGEVFEAGEEEAAEAKERARSRNPLDLLNRLELLLPADLGRSGALGRLMAREEGLEGGYVTDDAMSSKAEEAAEAERGRVSFALPIAGDFR